MRKFFGGSGSSNVTTKDSPKEKTNEKDVEKTAAKDKESQMEKRPGSAISQDFMPSAKKQQKAIKEWKKHEEQNKSQRAQTTNPYGYVPFKTAPMPMPIYGSRLAPNESTYMHSTYAPPQAIRPESAMTQDTMAHQPISRPGSDMGLYLSSRYQSYTTLPRPEHIEMDSGNHQKENIYGSNNVSHPTTPKINNRVAPLQEKPQIYGVRDPVKPINRTGSVNSESRSVQTANFLPPYPHIGLYGSLGIPPFDDESKGMKELVNWSRLSLCSNLQVLCGLCIFTLGVVRLFLKAEYAKGQELFYGISVMCAGLVGVFAVRHRSYCAAVSTFVHSTINAVLAAIPFLSGLLPLIPFAYYQKQPYVSFNTTDEPFEFDISLVILGVCQFVLALCTSIIGCKSAGHTIRQLETLRIQKILEKSIKDPHSP